MKRAWLILALLLLWPAPGRCESVQTAVEQQVATLDLAALTRAQERQSLVQGDLSELIRGLAGGKSVMDGPSLLQWLLSGFTDTLRRSLWRVTRLLVPALLMGVMEQLRGTLTHGAALRACQYAGLLVVLGFLAADLTEHAALAKEAISGMADTMQALFPLLVTLLAAVGGTASAAFFQPTVVAACGTMTALIQNATLPLATGTAVLTVVGCLCPTLHVDRLRRLFTQAAHWTLGVSFTVFIGVTIVQGLGTAAVDGVSIRTAKYALDNFIPIVGGMFADTVDTLVGCSLLIKNALGVVGLLLLVGRMLAPMLQTVCAMLLYRAAAAVLEPVSDSALCRCIGEFSEVFMLLFIIQLSVGAMFLLLVAQMLVVGNLTVMLR